MMRNDKNCVNCPLLPYGLHFGLYTNVQYYNIHKYEVEVVFSNSTPNSSLPYYVN